MATITLTPRVIPASELIEQAQLLRSRVAAGQLDVDEIDAARLSRASAMAQ